MSDNLLSFGEILEMKFFEDITKTPEGKFLW